MARTRLTARGVAQIKPTGSRQEIADLLLPGLYLVIQPSGARSWALRYRGRDGRHVKLTLGPAIAEREPRSPRGVPPIIGIPLTVADARELCRTIKAKIAAGVEPHEEKREEHLRRESGIVSADDVIETVVSAFFDRHVNRNLRKSTAEDMASMFRLHVLPAWGQRRLREIRRADVMALADRLADSGKGASANRLIRQVGSFFSWCVDRELIDVSPAARIRKPHQDRPRERFLADREIRWLWQATNRLGYPFGRIVELLLLTGVRREELAGAAWREFDLDEGTWEIPANRVKNGRAHLVLLSRQSQAILETLPRIANDAGLVFTVTGRTPVSGWSRAKSRLDAEMVRIVSASDRDADGAVMAAWTLHDLRRTMATGMAGLGVSIPVIERCLNHVSGSFGGIVGVYQRHDFIEEKRAAWGAWGHHVESLVGPEAGL